jgi:hypothetical protein
VELGQAHVTAETLLQMKDLLRRRPQVALLAPVPLGPLVLGARSPRPTSRVTNDAVSCRSLQATPSITAALATVRGDELDEPRAKAAYVWLVGELGA